MFQVDEFRLSGDMGRSYLSEVSTFGEVLIVKQPLEINASL